MILRQYAREDRKHAAELVRVWGYGRVIIEPEIEDGLWLLAEQDGCPAAIGWLVMGPGETHLSLHVARDPSYRGPPIGSRRMMQALEDLAGVLGADRLYAPVVERHMAEGVPVAALKRYLRIRGWSEDQLGMYKELGWAES